MSMQAKTFDLNMHIYLNQIACEYGLFNDVDSSRLYLISSLNKERDANTPMPNLIDVRLIGTDADSPTLSRLHKDVLMNIDLKLTLIDIVLNLNVMKNTINFAEKFEKSLNRIKYQEYQKEIDNLNKTMTSQHKKSTTNPIVSPSTNIPLLTDTQIQNIILNRTDNQTQVKKRHRKFIIDLNSIEMKLNAKFDGLRVRLSTQKKNYFEIGISTLEAELTSKAAEKNLEIVLNSISVLDLDENNRLYRKIVSLKESSKELIRVQIKLFNAPRTPLTQSSLLAAQYQKEKFYFKNYFNENYFDVEVNADISKLQFVFLYKNLNTLMVSLVYKILFPSNYFLIILFLQSLLKILEKDSSQELPKTSTNPSEVKEDSSSSSNQPSQKQEVAPQKASDNNRFAFLFKVKLDVTINAPIIYVPENSSSPNALLLDCGLITIRTSLEIERNYFSKLDVLAKLDEKILNHRICLPPVIEIQKVTLSNMGILRYVNNIIKPVLVV